MSKISKDEVKHVAHLARLAITEEEAEKFTKQLEDIINFAEQLNELDTENVEPLYFLNIKDKPYREDVVEESLDREEVLKNAPEEEYGYFKVKKVME